MVLPMSDLLLPRTTRSSLQVTQWCVISAMRRNPAGALRRSAERHPPSDDDKGLTRNITGRWRTHVNRKLLRCSHRDRAPCEMAGLQSHREVRSVCSAERSRDDERRGEQRDHQQGIGCAPPEGEAVEEACRLFAKGEVLVEK